MSTARNTPKLELTFCSAPILEKKQSTTRGVNLGGWLVLEPWITPSIFQPYNGAVVDEWTLCQNEPNAESVLQAHWSSWVTLADFQKIAGSGVGINTVRIPVGYWAFQKYDNDPFIMGAADYLAQALDWAQQTGIQVWIDLHGAPLSQNGFDNSGQRTNNPQWTAADTISFTTGVIGQIASRFGNHPAVAGIELVNEPLMSALPGGRDGVTDYYNQASGAVTGNSGTGVIIHDGFADPGSWAGIVPNSIVDHHTYQVFTMANLALSYQGHADLAYSRPASLGKPGRTVIAGEWTAAMTDCAPALVSFWPLGLEILLQPYPC